MKVNEIERLLARYYDGETSDTEEKELERFFALELSDSENRAILSENLEAFLDESYS